MIPIATRRQLQALRGAVQVRCSRRRCRQRFTLNKPPDHYKKPRKCPCGGTLNIDIYRTLGRDGKRQGVCYCGAFHYPHRRNSCANRSY